MSIAVNLTLRSPGGGAVLTGNWSSATRAAAQLGAGSVRGGEAKGRPAQFSINGDFSPRSGAQARISVAGDFKPSSGGLFGWFKGLAKGVLGLAGNILGRLPLVGIPFGVLNGLASGSLEQAVRSIPIIGNVYDAAKGLFSGQFGTALKALSGLVPFVGPALQLVDGLRHGSITDLIDGAAGLALDFATMGQGHFLKGRATANFARV